MKTYGFEIKITRDWSRYVFAIYSTSGFVRYITLPATRYSRKKIRMLLRAQKLFGEIKIPKTIRWNELPKGDFIEQKEKNK